MVVTFAASALRLALDPVHGTQRVFRALLEALARPGESQQVPVAAQDAPDNPWVAAVLLTLLDHETSLASAGNEPTDRFVRARTGARQARASEADFILADSATLRPGLIRSVRRGTLEYPDDSATLVVSVPSSARWTEHLLDGPGIDGTPSRLLPLSHDVLAARDAANANYPCGVDLLLIDAAGGLVGLPRTSRARRA